MGKSIIFRSILVLGLAALVATPFACGGKSSNSTAPPPPAKELASGDLGHLAVYQHTFANAGTFAYHCIHHANMQASITVDPASAVNALAVTISDNAFGPTSATVAPNATVTWTNNGVNTHTVTSN